MLIAQLSDPHIGAQPARLPRGVTPETSLAHAIASLTEALVPPDFVIVSGDLTESGQPQEYAQLRTLLSALSMPVYLMAGNHDDRDALRAAFPDHAYLAACVPFIQYVIDCDTWRIIVLDSLDPGRSSGRLCEQRLAWLDGELARAVDCAVVVFVHHPPFVTGVPHVDGSRLLDGDALARVLQRHPRVERVICGHLHRAMHNRWANTSVTTCPSTFFQFAIDLRERGSFVAGNEMPGYQLHRINGEALFTYTLSLEASAGN